MRLPTKTKSLLPLRTLGRIRAAHRRHVFRRAMRRFQRSPEICTPPGNSVVSDLVYGWGNESWSALDEYLATCIDHALKTNGPILECGSGLSTILVGYIANQRRIEYWALEHSTIWAMKTQSYLDEFNIDSVSLCVKPLADYGNYSWYDAPLESMPDSFALVICDGPPGNTKGGRSGLVSIMSKKLKIGTVILLDDAVRVYEREIAERWMSELGASIQSLGYAKPYIKLTIQGWRNQEERHDNLTNPDPDDVNSVKSALGG